MAVARHLDYFGFHVLSARHFRYHHHKTRAVFALVALFPAKLRARCSLYLSLSASFLTIASPRDRYQNRFYVHRGQGYEVAHHFVNVRHERVTARGRVVLDSDTYINQAGFRDSFIDDDFTPHNDTIGSPPTLPTRQSDLCQSNKLGC